MSEDQVMILPPVLNMVKFDSSQLQWQIHDIMEFLFVDRLHWNVPITRSAEVAASKSLPVPINTRLLEYDTG